MKPTAQKVAGASSSRSGKRKHPKVGGASNSPKQEQMAPATAKPTLTPKLRFPEFRKRPGWEMRPLDELGDFVGERVSVSTLNRKDYASTENLLPEFGGFSPPSTFPIGGSVIRYREYDILAANIRPYLKKIWLADRTGGASNDVIVIRAKESIGPLFLSHILKNDRFIAYVMSSAKGLKMPRGDVSLIRKYPVPTPSPPNNKKSPPASPPSTT